MVAPATRGMMSVESLRGLLQARSPAGRGLVVELLGTAGSGKTTLGVLVAEAFGAGVTTLAGLGSGSTYQRAHSMGYGNSALRANGRLPIWRTVTSPELDAVDSAVGPVGAVFWDTNDAPERDLARATNRITNLVQETRRWDRLLVVTNLCRYLGDPNVGRMPPVLRQLADVVLFAQGTELRVEEGTLVGSVIFHILRHPTEEPIAGLVVDLRTLGVRQGTPV